MHEPWPDLDGEIPDDWDDQRHWDAAKAMHAGLPIREIAAKFGLAPSTISGWKRQWRRRYGPEFLAADKSRNLEHAREIAAQQRLGTQWKRWADVRAAAASSNGVTADLGRQLAQRIIMRYLTDEEAFNTLDVRDAYTLIMLSDKAEKRADELSDIRRVAGGAIPVGGDIGGDEIPEGLLDALDEPVGDEFEQIVAQAAESATTFLHLVKDSDLPASGVIEVYETDQSAEQ